MIKADHLLYQEKYGSKYRPLWHTKINSLFYQAWHQKDRFAGNDFASMKKVNVYQYCVIVVYLLKVLWFTRSNALDKSKNNEPETMFVSITVNPSSIILIKAA